VCLEKKTITKPDGEWIKIIHGCVKPDLLPPNGNAGSIWQCGICGAKWEWIVNFGSIYMGSPWRKVEDNADND
jgi:hypothetical protein